MERIGAVIAAVLFMFRIYVMGRKRLVTRKVLIDIVFYVISKITKIVF